MDTPDRSAQLEQSPPSTGRPRISTLTLLMLLSMMVMAAVFSLWPGLDLAVSALFWDPGIDGFVGDHLPLIHAMYGIIPPLSAFIIVTLILAFIASQFDRSANGRQRRIYCAYLVVVLALGPGLVIDVVLKDYWGRARPAKITTFGGNATFSAALLPSDQCNTNCSFVSGHASAGFFFVSLGFLGGRAARLRWTLIGLALGGIAGLGRITQGGHFLSDVIFSFYCTWFSAWLVWVVFQHFGCLRDTVKKPQQ
ncbi:phosphoesterase [Betaproteobacteria bacterium]|nr:phosphoesterase [Betaproteobacteria bacterium]GHU24834.1 phosphoesterase [Betaproteobacteria bacterium]GHU27780.1 phosphoesterase [Betaproteobacteria bacterium]